MQYERKPSSECGASPSNMPTRSRSFRSKVCHGLLGEPGLRASWWANGEENSLLQSGRLRPSLRGAGMLTDRPTRAPGIRLGDGAALRLASCRPELELDEG